MKKESPLLTFRLPIGQVLCNACFFLFVEALIAALFFAFLLKPDYFYLVLLSLLFVVVLVIGIHFSVCSISVYPDYCRLQSYLHPLGETIKWENIEYIAIFHPSFAFRRLRIKYHDDKGAKRKTSILCAGDDDLEAIIPYLNPNTIVRQY